MDPVGGCCNLGGRHGDGADGDQDGTAGLACGVEQSTLRSLMAGANLAEATAQSTLLRTPSESSSGTHLSVDLKLPER